MPGDCFGERTSPRNDRKILIMNDISTALWITALGMGLVFGAIIVLWLMMVLLTAVSGDKKTAIDSKPETALKALTPHLSPIGSGENQARAAAIAVAMALAEQESSAAHPLPEPPTAIVSAWQLGMRTRLLAQKGNFRRR
jgi:Na+-transporting methylmalonyl-CoA/oxaloacetate decarboxylase gamma subunit